MERKGLLADELYKVNTVSYWEQIHFIILFSHIHFEMFYGFLYNTQNIYFVVFVVYKM